MSTSPASKPGLSVVPDSPEAFDLDSEVRAYADLAVKIEELQEAQTRIKESLREHLPEGTHTTSYGTKVIVSAPSRSFNLQRAWDSLTPEQQAVCGSPDAAKVKAQIPPVLLDSFMDAGKGENKVTVK